MKSRIQILAAAALFSTGGAAIKMTSLDGWQVAAFRSGVAALVMLLLLPEARKRWTSGVLLVSAAYAATLTLFVLANKMTTSANTIFLQSTSPLYLLILGPWLLKEKLKKSDALWMSLFAVGLALVLQDKAAVSRTASNPALGNLLAVGAGFTYALLICGLRWLNRETEGAGIRAAGAGNLLVFLVCVSVAIRDHGSIGAAFDGSARDWTVIAYLGVVQIGLAYWLLSQGVAHVPALETSLLILLEPALNPIWSMMIHGEQPGLKALAGGVVILGSTFAVLLSGREPATSQPPRILDSTPS